jgi:virulence-associated protein VagC
MADEWTVEVSGGKAVRLPAEVPVGQILTVRRGEQKTVYQRVIEPVEPGSEETHHVWREVEPGPPDEGDRADRPADQEKS